MELTKEHAEGMIAAAYIFEELQKAMKLHGATEEQLHILGWYSSIFTLMLSGYLHSTGIMHKYNDDNATNIRRAFAVYMISRKGKFPFWGVNAA